MEAYVIQNCIDWNILRRDSARHGAMLAQHDAEVFNECERNRRRYQRNIDALNRQLP